MTETIRGNLLNSLTFLASVEIECHIQRLMNWFFLLSAELPSWYANGQNYSRFKLSNALGISVEICSLGATVTSIKVPDRQGNFIDVILGFDNAQDYLSDQNPYFGATVGRVANRYEFAIKNEFFVYY